MAKDNYGICWANQGCQIFRNIPKRQNYTKWPQNVPNGHKIYRSAVNLTKRPLKNPSIFHCKAFQIYPNWGFWLENIPSGNTGATSNRLLLIIWNSRNWWKEAPVTKHFVPTVKNTNGQFFDLKKMQKKWWKNCRFRLKTCKMQKYHKIVFKEKNANFLAENCWKL
jgi:hypothetical protein